MHNSENGTEHFVVEDLVNQLSRTVVPQLNTYTLAGENAAVNLAGYTVVYCDILWCTVGYCSILWYIVIYCGIL